MPYYAVCRYVNYTPGYIYPNCYIMYLSYRVYRRVYPPSGGSTGTFAKHQFIRKAPRGATQEVVKYYRGISFGLFPSV